VSYLKIILIVVSNVAGAGAASLCCFSATLVVTVSGGETDELYRYTVPKIFKFTRNIAICLKLLKALKALQ
jgi:hypothetical protein